MEKTVFKIVPPLAAPLYGPHPSTPSLPRTILRIELQAMENRLPECFPAFIRADESEDFFFSLRRITLGWERIRRHGYRNRGGRSVHEPRNRQEDQQQAEASTNQEVDRKTSNRKTSNRSCHCIGVCDDCDTSHDVVLNSTHDIIFYRIDFFKLFDVLFIV